MKNLLFILIILLLTGCATIQIMSTKSTSCEIVDNVYSYEKDSVKITYDFWSNYGVMRFAILNNSNSPIYINWKNSSFILNGTKYDYWIDVENTKTEALTAGYSYRGRYGWGAGASATSAESVTVKLEKITFIPPKSKYTKKTFNVTDTYYRFPKDLKAQQEPLSDSKKGKAMVYSQEFDDTNTPLTFRNYIAISKTEDGNSFSFIDNGFYLKSIRDMSLRHFHGKATKATNDEYPKREKNKMSFYVDSGRIGLY